MSKGWPVLTAAETRAAEQAIFDGGMPVIDLMEKAGAAAARIIATEFAPAEALILCGPGNNGGDGYVIGRCLRERGWTVRMVAFAEPKSDTARLARQRWHGPVEQIGNEAAAPLFIDSLFGIDISRSLEPALQRIVAGLVEAADHAIAIDLPSGVSTDDGRLLGHVPRYDLTIALGCLKPAHLRQPGASRCGKIKVADIGLIVRE